MPTAEQLNEHYQNLAYFEGEEEQGYLNYADMRKALQPHFARRLGQLKLHFPDAGRILDFGCAAGYFLEMAKEKGWQIAGVELSQEMAERASQALGITVENSLSSVPQSNFDAVTLWEVIEHVPQPVEQLRQLFAQLRPGGVLMLSTPNNGHWQAIRKPESWGVYRPPSHLIYFRESTLRSALERAGFEKIEVNRVLPLPELPQWLDTLSKPIQRGLFNGQARLWKFSLYTWRLIRLFGWVWQKFTKPQDDIFTTLEAIAFRPK